MKKVYNAPKTEEINLNMESHLLDGSIQGLGDNVTVNGFDDDEYNGEGASRYYDDWD